MTDSRVASMADVRAATDEFIIALDAADLHDVACSVRNLVRSRDAHSQHLASEIDDMAQAHAVTTSAFTKRLDDAFPGKDARAHREAHEAWMGREARRAKLSQAIIEKSLIGLFWMVLLGLGTAVWQWVKASVQVSS